MDSITDKMVSRYSVRKVTKLIPEWPYMKNPLGQKSNALREKRSINHSTPLNILNLAMVHNWEKKSHGQHYQGMQTYLETQTLILVVMGLDIWPLFTDRSAINQWKTGTIFMSDTEENKKAERNKLNLYDSRTPRSSDNTKVICQNLLSNSPHLQNGQREEYNAETTSGKFSNNVLTSASVTAVLH